MMGRFVVGGGRRRIVHGFNYLISVENLLVSWKEFLKGKRNKPDIANFSLNLMDHIFDLHSDLVNHTYSHGSYQAFRINDPKPRQIHKASVRDRLLHHAVYRVLYPFFDRKFISDSFSCRLNKGTHRAMNRFRGFGSRVSRNHTRTCWVLKCDIRKFFENIDHEILISILKKYILDKDLIWLLTNIIQSFESKPNKGLPLGNLTSQLLVNIYMNEFDQAMKRIFKVKYYIRYADDFVILSHDLGYVEDLLPKISNYLQDELKLQIHPNKVFIKTLASGVDFLGWVHFADHQVLRTVTKRRMFKKLNKNNVQSYFGLLSHGNTTKLRNRVDSLALFEDNVPNG